MARIFARSTGCLMSDTTDTLTTQQVADLLGISIGRVYSLARRRGLGRRFGPLRMFSRADLANMAIRSRRGFASRPKTTTEEESA